MNLLRRQVLASVIGLGMALTALAAVVRPYPASQPVNPASEPSPSAPRAATVSLSIDYRDGARRVFDALPHTAEMTVLDVLNLAARHPHGITFVSSGAGETAFVRQIDDLKNQGGGTAARNWQFLVNGKVGTRGVGATHLRPGDAVTWDFDTFKLPTGESK